MCWLPGNNDLLWTDGPYASLAYEINLKTLDTIGNCRRPVFSLGASQHMHKVTNLYKNFVLAQSVVEVARY